jgi:hypothetical protein
MTRDDIIRMALAGEQSLEDRISYAIALEREACAKLVDEEMADYRYGTPPNIALNNAAAAIRERGAP